MTDSLHAFVDELNRTFEKLHTEKENAFWNTYMGLSDDADSARKELDRCEVRMKEFFQDPERLRSVTAAQARWGADGSCSADDLTALSGWVATFEAHGIDDEEARRLSLEIVDDEGALGSARGKMELGYQHPDKGFVRASSVELSVMLDSEPNEALRRAAWEGLSSIEGYVLDHGFLDVVKKRNRLGRMLGAEDYYDWKVRIVERMSKREVFDLLDDLEVATRDAARTAVEQLAEREGGELAPWNMRYLIKGDVTTEQDPYFPFEHALERWGRSFAAMGIRYRGADLVLDLVDRRGKYENGFMHGPVPAWRDANGHRPARIQFTANAIPGMIGSGERAMETLFHEGGHAAHFANIDMPSPCFAQEFAPTSVAFAETQSMFLDSLLEDADWRRRYALDAAGEPMPLALIEKGIRATQPFAAYGVRGMLAVCYGEKAIYEIPDDELTAERVLEELRAVERRLVFLEGGAARPVLSVPHLLDGESSAYYHGYVLALMAVHQTRAFFLERDGHLVDNPRIGPDLARAYWQPGNSKGFGEFLEELTGETLNARFLAEHVTRPVDECLEAARRAVEKLPRIPTFEGVVDLDAALRMDHGRETIASLGSDGFESFARTYGAWIREQVEARASG